VVILDHVGRLQVFMIDGVIATHETQGGLMVEVLPLASHLLVRLGKQVDRFTPTVAPRLAATDATLRPLERPFRLAIPAGMKDAVA
jgi:hypothetical protein